MCGARCVGNLHDVEADFGECVGVTLYVEILHDVQVDLDMERGCDVLCGVGQDAWVW
jgi:hypothetical protein